MIDTDTGDDTRAIAEFDESIYPLLSLQKAAYELSSQASVSVDTVGQARLRVTLESPSGNARQILGRFKARVADLALQAQIDEQTRTVREALVTAALWESLPRQVR